MIYAIRVIRHREIERVEADPSSIQSQHDGSSVKRWAGDFE